MNTGNPSSNDGHQRRPPTSSILWAHLLKKDTLAKPANSEIPLPPTAPVDKSAISTRILLHDTQANFQKFGERVDRLTSRVDEAKHEITVVKTLFQKEHESLVGDVVDLVNRSQTEIQKSVGLPAQANKLEELRQSIILRIEGLDKRIDAIQMFHQTHSQTLQSQMQALQTLQDQQSSIIASLIPLLPLLQAVPLHIEAARNTINESLSKSMESIQLNTISPIRKLQLARKPSGPDTSTKKRTATPSSLSRKRQRLDENYMHEGIQASRRSQVFMKPSTPNECQNPVVRRSPADNNHPRDVPSSITKSSALSSLIGREPSFSFRRPSTPRRPLADLPLIHHSASFTSKINNKTSHSLAADAYHELFGPQARQASLAITNTPFSRYSRQNSRAAEHSSTKKTTHRSPTASVADGGLSRPPSSPSPALEPRPAISVMTNHLQALSTHQRPDTPLIPNTFSTLHAVPCTAVVHSPTLVTNVQIPAMPRPESAGGTSAMLKVTRESVPRSLPVVGHAIPVPPTLRQRRSPFREGRRFIPLDDSDDSDEQGE